MHHYPRNSPQAAARLVALAMLSDGNVCRSEVDAAGHHGAETGLGLAPGGLGAVLQTLCEDLLCSGQSNGSLTSCIDQALLESLIRDVDEPDLQRKVMATIVAVVAADGHLSEAEQHVLDTMQRCWNVQERPAERTEA